MSNQKPQDEAALVATLREFAADLAAYDWNPMTKAGWLIASAPTLLRLAEEALAMRAKLAVYEEHIKLRNRTNVHQLAEIEELRRRLTAVVESQP